MKFEKIKMKIIPFSFALCPPRWSLKKRRKNVGLEHKGPSLGLARWKKNITDGSWYELASKMRFVRRLFDEICGLMHFVLVFLQKCAPRCHQKHIFENRCYAKCLQNCEFWVTFGCINPFNPPPQGPLPPLKIAKHVAPVRVWSTFSIWGRFSIIICNLFLLSP